VWDADWRIDISVQRISSPRRSLFDAFRNSVVSDQTQNDLTTLLNAWGRVDASTVDGPSSPASGVDAIYERCRLLVRRVKRRASSLQDLDTTDLLHRAWERTLLAKGDLAPGDRWASREQFFASIARATIESIIDEARSRKALKRGGGRTTFHTGNGHEIPMDLRRGGPRDDMDEETRAALRQALDEFATIDPRACTVVTLRQFWEFSCAEIAASFGVTERTVNRDWRAARAWLARRVNQILGVPGGGPPRE
jgi:RNA polymerase sigma factor (TIGR02999 family)